jgi:hypothetical protein
MKRLLFSKEVAKDGTNGGCRRGEAGTLRSAVDLRLDDDIKSHVGFLWRLCPLSRDPIFGTLRVRGTVRVSKYQESPKD